MIFNLGHVPGVFNDAVYMPGVEVTEVTEPAPKPPPEIPPPCWDDREIDAEKAMAAVRAMCG